MQLIDYTMFKAVPLNDRHRPPSPNLTRPRRVPAHSHAPRHFIIAYAANLYCFTASANAPTLLTSK
jgi:hypothetical protein